MTYELPEPAGAIAIDDGPAPEGRYERYVDGYTADQVLAAYRAGIEDAAKRLRELAANQESLGAEFEVVLTSNLWELYSRDVSAKGD